MVVGNGVLAACGKTDVGHKRFVSRKRILCEAAFLPSGPFRLIFTSDTRLYPQSTNKTFTHVRGLFWSNEDNGK